MRYLSLQRSNVPLAMSLVIPSFVSRRALCSFCILVQTSLIIIIAMFIIFMYCISLEAVGFSLDSGVTDLLLRLGSSSPLCPSPDSYVWRCI